jgi:hypothetical protein
VHKHYKNASTHEQTVWVATANNALKEYGGDEGKAIRTANAAVNKLHHNGRATKR